ncbi:SRPBCC family protein [Leifsonia sp. AG29]|uniref:SRPBCC family protein n=1 Tax=Leifsonia sp. AG29 TaxID=2598860 RepID=UPI00131E648B|nr:SRPBCC domain-containing protein [Leifsonia sp. AG29]
MTTAKAPDYTATIELGRSPDDVFAAIADVGDWWLGEVTGQADRVGAEFTYRYQDIHASTQRVTEFLPGRRIVWDVVDSDLSFVSEPDPWTGTRIVFDLQPSGGGTRLTFTHQGLTPAKECYGACSAGWDHFVIGSLRQFVEAGVGVPL